jgi:hypothetical protein
VAILVNELLVVLLAVVTKIAGKITYKNIMKHVLLLIASASLIGCTTYPKDYVYSPTVTVSGNDNTVILPSPFAKNSPKNVYSSRATYFGPEPSPLTANIPQPPPSADYYYDYNVREEHSICFDEGGYPNRW